MADTLAGAAPDVVGDPSGTTARRDRPPPRRPRKRLRLAVVGAVLVAALVYVLVEGLGSSLDYYHTVDQALAQRSSIGTSTFRLEGVVLPHTVRRTAAGADFSVGEGKTAVQVHNTGSPPQLFEVGVPVIVVGHFARGSELFVSDQIMVKHSANYTPATSASKAATSSSG